MSDFYIFLDIDGVLNAFAWHPGIPDYWGDLYLTDIDGYDMRLSQRQADAIKNLGGTIIWCTTWQDTSYLVGEELGIEADYLTLGFGWKREAVNNFLKNNPKPWVWFEDEPGAYGTYNMAGFDNLPKGFIVNPHPSFGVTPEHIESVEEWLNTIQTS